VRSRSLLTDLRILACTLALPATLLLRRLRASSTSFRVWFPTAVSAIVLVLVFFVTSSHLS
jgi:hypothetical protein